MDDRTVGDTAPTRTERPAAPAQALPAPSALAAVRRGWSVVPLHSVIGGCCSCGDRSCPAPGKHTHVAWKRYMGAPAGPEQVRRWWRRWPRANLGVVTGAVSGLVVLDVDPRHGGGYSLAICEQLHGPLAHTVESLTGGGGQHLYFTHPGTAVPCRPIAPGLDVKGDGGLVVCPPSLHVSGRRYVWETRCAPDEIAVAEAPGWLLAMARDAATAFPGATARTHRAPVRTAGERDEFAALWAEAGIELRSGDRNYLCPFHPDHHPSLHIDADGCRFYCFGCGRGGGSGRLRRLVGVARQPGRRRDPAVADRAPPGPAPAVTLPGTTEVRVVGGAAHQDALLELTGGQRHYGGVRIETVARLVVEADNPTDPGAVAVDIGGCTVGYLSRPDAALCRAAIDDAVGRTGEATCAATIVGGWEREHGDIGFFGVRLYLDLPDEVDTSSGALAT